jgi:hypothetical protein
LPVPLTVTTCEYEGCPPDILTFMPSAQFSRSSLSLSIAAGQGRIRRRAGEHAEIRIKASSFGAVKIDTGDAGA